MLEHAFTLVIAVATSAAAQAVHGAVSLDAGSATDVRGVTSRALTVTPSLSLAPDPRVLLVLDGAATRFDAGAWSATAGAGLNAREEIAPHAAFTFAAAGAFTQTSYQYSYNTANALPALELSAGPVTVFGGVRGSVASASSLTATTPVPGLLGQPTPPTISRASVSRAAAGVLGGVDLQAAVSNAGFVRLDARAERTAIDSARFVDHTLTASLVQGRATVVASAGFRSGSVPSTSFGSAALAVELRPGVALRASAGTYPSDPLVGMPGGRFVNVGFVLQTGGHAAPAGPTVPSADGVDAPAPGFTRVAIRAPDARRVELAGDFTDWRLLAARRAENGVWYLDLRIPPGQYRYAFRIDGSTWTVPTGAPTTDDGFGGKAAWLVVRDTTRNDAR